MASGVPASDIRGASQARRVDGVPALGMRPQQVSAAPYRRSTRHTTREFIPVTARVNKKKGHSPRLYYAPRGVNIAPWGLPSCGDGARYHPDLVHHRRPIALARVRVQPTAAPAERAILLLPVAGRVVRGGADDIL